jgi:inner membrane protein involved in colicin E2 resistance
VLKKIVAITFFYLIATIAWVSLGSTLVYRTADQDSSLREEVGQLWGTPLAQKAPSALLVVYEKAKPTKGKKNQVVEEKIESGRFAVPIVENKIRADLQLDQRQKGLLWYSTYRVHFTANYTFENIHDKKGDLIVNFAFPNSTGIYDDFTLQLDGASVPFTRQDSNLLVAIISCEAKTQHALAINYSSQGLDRFIYDFGEGVSEVRNFQFVANTDFTGYDFAKNTLSPSEKKRTDKGWELNWRYTNLISGSGIGIEMPKKINPGPMASRISFFAPISLAFFFFLVFVTSLLKGIEIHPINYFFLAASFFAFHLLLAYLVDHISIHLAFLICSAVSIFLVLSYMRLVTGSRFAFIESALSQLIYLVGFSYAFFFEGFTGLAVTIGAIITLFVVMQMTAKINWAEKFQLRSEATFQSPPTGFNPPR